MEKNSTTSPSNLANLFVVPLIVLLGLILAGVFWLRGGGAAADNILMATLIAGSLQPLYKMAKDLARGHFGVDIIAILAILSSFFLRQYLAGTVIALMLSGGEALEGYALRRARKELSRLVSNAPSVAHLKQNGGLKDISAAEVSVGNIIIVKPGETAPVDGLVTAGASEVDESALTGESLPRPKTVGSLVLSGSVNKENLLELKAVRPAAESKYEQIIQLVKQAEESRAPVVRLADRYSVWFTAITLVLAGGAWFISHDPVRLLAVLVVATPCPLILATPIAIISGISKSASRGIIVKSGGALETLAEVKAFIFDKTGTLTLGTPKVAEVRGQGIEPQEALRLAASLDQMSAHILARALLNFARSDKKIELAFPENFKETFGEGVSGRINGAVYLFGKMSFLQKAGIAIEPEILALHHERQEHGVIAVYLGRADGGGKGSLLGSVLFADEIRPEIKNLFKDLTARGIRHIVMLTGDKQAVADKIGRDLGLDDIHAESLPDQKLAEIKDHQKQFGKVAMVGDGVNDAPALATADVGIALGGHGSTATADTSDIVITLDNLQRVGEAYKIASRVLSIAKQGIFIGIGLSIFLMILASLGYIVPVYGALLQEVIDVAVILNALRVNFEGI